MTYDYEISVPIAELLTSQNEVIAKYKWFESQHRGADIGWTRAANEWFEKHFADWVRAQLQVIAETLSMTSEHGVRELQPL